MPYFIRCAQTLIFVSLIFAALNLQASSSAAEGRKRLAQRSDFQAAESALKQGKLQKYHKLKATLKNYPLYPYLEYREIIRNLASITPASISSFLTQNTDTPLARRLCNIWLNHLAERQQWASYLSFFRPTASTAQTCNFLQALIGTGRTQSAYQQVGRIWLSGKSRPKACDPVFQAWREAGHLTQQLVWGRIELAMETRNTRLAQYLGRFLHTEDRSWLDLWLKADRTPNQLANLEGLKQNHPQRNSILAHGIKRLARIDPDQAFTLWQQLSTEYDFRLSQQLEVERALALQLVYKGTQLNFDVIQRIEPCEDDLRLHEARIRAALAQREWEAALSWIEALPKGQQEKESWLYWRARALSELGHDPEAGLIFNDLANQRSYYGFLAADRLGKAYRLDHNPVQLETGELDSLAGSATAQRAYELYALERMTSARREWNWLTRNMTNRQLQVAAKLAQDWGWHDRAIFTLAKTRYWDDLELRFPLEHRPWIEKQAGNRQLDSAWVFAVVRQESAFLRDARSSAGALGLMQLMPRTARSVAKSIGGQLPRKSELLKPTTNIKLGTAYLRKVLDTFGQHPVLATAAYNAGPHRVRSWLPDQTMPADLWVETIPFNETRGYLRRVMAYTIIYQQRLGVQPHRLHERMRPINGKLIAATATSTGKEG